MLCHRDCVPDYKSTESEFQLNRKFRRPYGNAKMGGTMLNNCSRPDSGTILCR